MIPSCLAGKITEDSICFLTSSEPEKVQTRSIGNNEGVGVAIEILSARKYPNFHRLPSTCTAGN